MREGFHAKDGLHFQRMADGTVVVSYATQQMESPDDVKVWILDPSSWASVLAYTSQLGSTSEGYAAARAFHGATTEAAS